MKGEFCKINNVNVVSQCNVNVITRYWMYFVG